MKDYIVKIIKVPFTPEKPGDDYAVHKSADYQIGEESDNEVIIITIYKRK
jgi:hypothetical protein